MSPSSRVEELRQEDCCKFKNSLNLTDTLFSTRTERRPLFTTSPGTVSLTVPMSRSPSLALTPVTRPPVQTWTCG